MLILKSIDAAEAVAEHDIVEWFRTNFGDADTDLFCDWLWARERNAKTYVDAMIYVAKEISTKGKPFFENILEYAKKQQSSPQVRDAEAELYRSFAPELAKCRRRFAAEKSKEGRDDALLELRTKLAENVHKLWPDKHRATVAGAIMSGTRHGGIDFGEVARALIQNADPLAVNAAASWA